MVDEQVHIIVGIYILEYAVSLTYADDTSTSVSGKDIFDVLKKLEVDAVNVLNFMAANGLSANPNKTTFIILNDRAEVRMYCMSAADSFC